MTKRKMRMAALVLSAALAGSAQAALVDRGGGLIYDTDLNITWLQDANYAKTSGYDADGAMTWGQAVTWAASLSFHDALNGITYDNWRLPTVTDTGPSGCDYALTGTDCGFSVDPSTSEMAHLFYNELGNKSLLNTTSSTPQPGWGLTNTGPFINLQASNYWSETEYILDTANQAWYFNFSDGNQDANGKGFVLYALAVSPGDIAAVPEPETYAMMLAGLLAVGASLKQRRG